MNIQNVTRDVSNGSVVANQQEIASGATLNKFEIENLNSSGTLIMNKFIQLQSDNITKNSDWYHPNYIKGFNKLFDQGFTMSDFLSAFHNMGWQIAPIEGYLSVIEYFRLIDKKMLPVNIKLRPDSQIEYAKFPDMIHDIMGHAPLILDEGYLSFITKISAYLSTIELTAIDKEYLGILDGTIDLKENKFTRIKEISKEFISNPTKFFKASNLATWTIEFGILGDEKPFQVYGAALVGSVAEMNNIVRGVVKIVNLKDIKFDLLYNYSSFQDRLYTAESFDQVLDIFKKICTNE